MANVVNFIDKVLPVVFAGMLIFFIINHDWSKSKIKRWLPYLFIVFLVFYILNSFLKFIGIDIITQILDKDISSTFLDNIFNKK